MFTAVLSFSPVNLYIGKWKINLSWIKMKFKFYNLEIFLIILKKTICWLVQNHYHRLEDLQYYAVMYISIIIYPLTDLKFIYRENTSVLLRMLVAPPPSFSTSKSKKRHLWPLFMPQVRNVGLLAGGWNLSLCREVGRGHWAVILLVPFAF